MREMFGRSQEWVLGGSMANEGYGMHEEYIIEVVSKGWVSGSKVWLVVWWDTGEIFPRSGKEGYIYAARSQYQGVLCPTKVTVSMRRVLLRFYQCAGLLVARVGWWGAEMGVRFWPRWEKVQDGTELRTKESVLGGFACNEGYCVHGEGTVEVLSSCWVGGGHGWVVGFRVQGINISK
jgi:hypothetical protein